MKAYLDIRAEIAAALGAGRPAVALETTLIAHGLPFPGNLEAGRAMAAAVRAGGAVPATIGLIDGRVRVGLTDAEIERFAGARDAIKVSRRDLAPVLARGGLGATTVAGTMVCAALAGIRTVATGGIGGVHRGGPNTLDVSADLAELARTPVAVLCSGAKSILDLGRTLEVLETAGVPVVGYGTDELPAFYARRSGLRLAACVETPAEAARLLRAHWGLGLASGIVIANPPPPEAALDAGDVEAWIEAALDEARAQGIAGNAVTPFVLARLTDLSDGRTGSANLALLKANARLAAEIATAYAEQEAR